MEVTGKNQDECMVALHDCNEDVSRAINFLLECTSDMVNKTLCQLFQSCSSAYVNAKQIFDSVVLRVHPKLVLCSKSE